MTTYKREDGDEEILLWEKPEWEILTWCKDLDGQEPAEVHYILKPTPGVKMLVRFHGPKGIDELILALTRHRNDVWSIDDIPLGSNPG